MNTLKKAPSESRRGVLLLVVLSTLIVFLLLGTLLLTQSTRSRTAARAFTKVTASSASNGALAREVLDEALMQLIRGNVSDDPTQATDSTNPTNDSILLDKFHGSVPVYADATSVTPWPTVGNQPFLRVIITAPTSGSVSSPLELNGRILTFLPPASQAGTVSSYRIFRARASGGGYELFLANMSAEPGASPPTSQCPVIINSPEFRVEGHDSFSDDFWLTEVREIDQGKPKVLRPAFEPTAVDANRDGIHDTLEVDNDGDGELDGIWRNPRIFSTRALSDGTQYEFDVSYLVQDLDSRVNLNAHSTNPVAGTDWVTPTAFGGTPTDFEDIPPGGGWGVADVRVASVFEQGSSNPPPDVNRIIRVRDGGATSGDPSSSGVRHPYVGAIGGVGATGSTTASQYEQLLYGDSYTVDLKSLAKIYVATPTAGTSSLRYAFTNSPDITYSPSFPDFSFAADPYELRLDSAAPRQNSLNSSAFSLTELERVLRLYDGDSNALPQRLAAVLGSDLENVRTVVTTDSWDTPALTGDVATTLETYFGGLPSSVDPYDLLSPDLASGRRFDVNRPVSTPAQKQLYCRDLFVLLVALGASADADLAQWVVNVMDYRDPGSTMTGFEWDDNLTNGWDPSQNSSGNEPDATQPSNRNPVYGTEMPELILGQTIAWYDKNDGSGGLHVLLMRPPSEWLDIPGQAPEPVTVLEDALAVVDSNGGIDNSLLDLGRRVDPSDATSSPVWRLAYYKLADASDEDTIVQSTVKYIRFDLLQSDLPNNSSLVYHAGNTSAPRAGVTANRSDAMHIPAGDYLCVSPTGITPVSSVTVPEVFAEHGAPIRFEGLAGVNAANNESFRVALERLQDPEAEFSETSNPYVAIGSMPVRLQNDTGGGGTPNYKSYRRQTPEFWKTPSDQQVGPNPTIASLDSTSRDIFNWPNRPFVSQAELALVPQGSGRGVFDNIRIPAGGDYFYLTDKGFLTAGIAQQLMAATCVASRHAGTSVTYDTNSLSSAQKEAVGLSRAGAGDVYPSGAPQIATWRDPGRVNVNTIAMEPSVSALTNYGNQRVWRAMFGSGSVGVGSGYIVDIDDTQTPFGGDVKEVHELLSLGRSNELYLDGGVQAGLHPALAYRTAIKLGNVATTRSNVFAVWITLRIRNTQTDEKTYRRLFAIIDRSIPVAFSPGQDLNSANTIRLKRYLD